MKQILIVLTLGIFVSSCVGHRPYIADYTNHPGARVECARFLEHSANQKTEGNLSGDLNIRGGAESSAKINALSDEFGLIHQACLDNWAIQQASLKAQQVNGCIFFLTSMIITIPLIPFCI